MNEVINCCWPVWKSIRVFIHLLYRPGGRTLRVVQNSSRRGVCQLYVSLSNCCAICHPVVLLVMWLCCYCHFDILWSVGGRTTGSCNWLVFVIVTLHST